MLLIRLLLLQDAVNFCIEQLGRGNWVHVFPEGKVNISKEYMRMKWGVGRMIYESPVTPILVPIWHLGMDEVLPNEPPYIPKAGKRLTFNFGQPIDFNELVADLRRLKVTDEEARKAITDKIEEELLRLKEKTEQLHSSHHSS
ncbi:hypothetical protein LSTR_LSTR017488 [Laodelphax striatellus]|uniref:Tafazzin family protein n=1 Tax=Laodelphax striatellus TaxID=195883 RepID=A0A482XC74_LAOST|nr:hypothetical protein LSTR_LSTR017488 [Laodelphax striatellus]